jgi:NAD(P)-dependent dehydrogenase (short-subunit alcohol dehydrogenase family)
VSLHHISKEGVFMSEQVVLITGALTGIGRATAIAFAREGAKVVVTGRQDKDGQKLVIELRNLGAEAEFVRADVRREGDIQKLADYAVSRFGRLDVAVNNAGTDANQFIYRPNGRDLYRHI